VLVTQPSIKTPKDLDGKVVMGSTFEDLELNFMPYFQAYGLQLKDITLVPHTYRLKEFIEKKVDAMTAFRSDQVHKLDKLGIKYNILDPSDENLYVLQEELFTSAKEAQNHPLRVAQFRDASIKGWEYALQHPQELVEIIHTKYSPNISKEDLLAEAQGVKKLIMPYAYDIGSINCNFLNKQMHYFKDYYKIDTTKDLDGFVFHRKGLKKVVLSQKQKEYIAKNRDVSVCTQKGFFPLVGEKNGKIVGEIADIYNLISQKTGLVFKQVKQNEKCQVLCIATQKGIKKFPNFQATSPLMQTHLTLISKLDKPFTYGIDDLKNKQLLVQKESIKEYLQDLYPSVIVKVVCNEEEMVHQLLDDDTNFAIVTFDEQADYIIEKYGYAKLKINGFLLKDKPVKFVIGVDRNNSILYSIIESTINSISNEEIKDIQNSWRLSRYQTRTDYTLVVKIVLFMVFILALMYYYQRKLKHFNLRLERLVDAKTKELRQVNEDLEASVQEKVEELIKKDKILTIQSKQAVMGEMLSMIAHQWRQPLNTITLQISNLQIQEMMGVKTKREDLLKMLDEISKTIVYLSDTIDDFKTYFDPNKVASRVDIEELFKRAIKFVQPRIKSENIQLQVEVTEDIELNIYTNEFIQIILNILNNAIDAYRDNKELQERIIQLSAKRVEDGCIEVTIFDKAGGISKENLKKIFDPYFSTKGKNGTGLGLYMSKMIVEKQFGGKIEVQSYDGSTKFIITMKQDVEQK
jgi:signal transduction histidine kinase